MEREKPHHNGLVGDKQPAPDAGVGKAEVRDNNDRIKIMCFPVNRGIKVLNEHVVEREP